MGASLLGSSERSLNFDAPLTAGSGSEPRRNLNPERMHPVKPTPAEIASPYLQGFADSRHCGTRNGPVHLFMGNRRQREWNASPLCARRVKLWNFEGETETDFCPRCLRAARKINAAIAAMDAVP